MTDQLHELLTRIADQAGPGPNDPTLWHRARRTRRDRRRYRVMALSAAAAAVVTAVVAVGIDQYDDPPPPQPVEQPDLDRRGSGIPSTIYGVPGDGGLPLETDLAIGQASVAIANPVGVFVVTAEDGVYHRLRLPGYAAASYDAGRPGTALSPDGTRLAYGWSSSALRPDGRPRRTGLRVLDLTTGSLWSERFHEELGADLNVYAWDLRWSPDGRYLGASVAIHEVGGLEHWYALLDPSARRVVREMWHSTQWPDPPMPIMVSSAGQVAAIETDPRDRLATWVGERWRRLGVDANGLSTGRFSQDGRWLALVGRGLQAGIEFVEPGEATAVFTAGLPERYPAGAAVDMLAWTGQRQVLALVWPGVGPGTVGSDAELAVLTVDPAPAELRTRSTSGDVRLSVEVVGHVVDSGPEVAVSVASDLAAGRRTQDFDPPPFVGAAGRD